MDIIMERKFNMKLFEKNILNYAELIKSDYDLDDVRIEVNIFDIPNKRKRSNDEMVRQEAHNYEDDICVSCGS